MQILKTMLKQWAVYYPPTDPDERGRHTYGDPEEIRCRWQDGQVEYVDSTGQVQISRSVVFTDKDLELGGVLILGRLKDLAYPDHADENEDYAVIQGFAKIPTLDGKKFLRKYFL